MANAPPTGALRGELILPRSRTQSPVSIKAADDADDSIDLDFLPASELRRLARERLAQMKVSRKLHSSAKA